MSTEHEYVKVDIAMEVDYPASQGTEAPPTPTAAHVSYVIDTPGPRPGAENLYDGYEVTSVPASSREVVEWQGAYRRFDERVQVAHLTLQVAEQAWREAMAVWTAEITQAVQEYAPVHEEIEARKAMVEAEDALLMEREKQARALVEEAVHEAEDAAYGPRTFVTYRSVDGTYTLHTVQCRRYLGRTIRSQWSKPFRKGVAENTVRRHRKACKQCGSLEHLAQLQAARIPQQRQA